MPNLFLSALLLAALVPPSLAKLDITGALFQNPHADPCILRLENGTYVSFADKRDVAVSTTTTLTGPWKELDKIDIIFDRGGNWTNGKHFAGAPDVTQLNDGSFIMYYTAQPKNQGGGTANIPHMCIGVARAQEVLGPYHAEPTPYLCGYGGVGESYIAPSLYQHDNKNYLLYKNGSSFSHSGISRTTIKQVGDDGTTNITGPVTIYSVNKDGVEYDVEGATLAHNQGTYFLFYDASYYKNVTYRIDYATSKTLMGRYEYKGGVMLKTGDYGDVHLVTAGGIDFIGNSATDFTFMSYAPDATVKPDGQLKDPLRQLHAARLEYDGLDARVASSPNGLC